MGKIFDALFTHHHTKQADLTADLFLKECYLFLQSIEDPNELKNFDKGAINPDPTEKRLSKNQLIPPECKFTKAEKTNSKAFKHDNSGLMKAKKALNNKGTEFSNDVPRSNKVLNKKQIRQSQSVLQVPQESLKRKFLSQSMRNLLPKFIDVGLVRIIFDTKFLFSPQKYIKLEAVEKIEYCNKIYYISYLKTEITFSVILDRTGNFIMFTLNSCPLTSSTFDNNSVINIVNSQKMLELKTNFFNKFKLLFNNHSFEKLFYDVFQLQIKNIVNCDKGDFLNIQDQIFYQIFLNASISFSLIIDNKSNYIEMYSGQNNLIPGRYLIKLLSFQDPICKIDLKKLH